MAERRLPDDLEHVAAHLRANRAQADPLELDRIKRTVMARSSRNPQGGFFMKSRVATAATLVALIGGTGGAIAIGATGSSNGPQGGAASGQYCGPKNHKCPPPHKKHHHKNRHPCARYAGKYARHRADKAAKPHSHNKHAYNKTFNKTYNPAYNQAFNAAWKKQHHKS